MSNDGNFVAHHTRGGGFLSLVHASDMYPLATHMYPSTIN
jgi:hypothetical protein